jgi:putative ATP-binding cassette transporter
MLSNGERQRLAFARLLLQRPTIVILDDALGALGDESQAEIMQLLRSDLYDTMLISVAQHGGLEQFHDRTLTLVKTPGGARFKM